MPAINLLSLPGSPGAQHGSMAIRGLTPVSAVFATYIFEITAVITPSAGECNLIVSFEFFF